jgi:hypothetical protein
MDGRLYFLAAADFDPFFLPEKPKPVVDVAAYFELLAATITGLQNELKDQVTVESQTEAAALHGYRLLKKVRARGRAFFRQGEA